MDMTCFSLLKPRNFRFFKITKIEEFDKDIESIEIPRLGIRGLLTSQLSSKHVGDLGS